MIKTELLIIEVFKNKLYKQKIVDPSTFRCVVAFGFPSIQVAIFVVTCKTWWSQEKNLTDHLHEGRFFYFPQIILIVPTKKINY